MLYEKSLCLAVFGGEILGIYSTLELASDSWRQSCFKMPPVELKQVSPDSWECSADGRIQGFIAEMPVYDIVEHL